MRGFYRFLENKKVTESALIKAIQKECKLKLTKNRLLVISDTCTVTIANENNDLLETNGLYRVGQNQYKDKDVLGFMIHPYLVLDRENGMMRGIANIKMIDRDESQKDVKKKRDLKRCPIEEKESYKWLGPAIEVLDTVLEGSEEVLYVMDREGDIIEVLDSLKTQRSDVLVRSMQNRIVRDKNGAKGKLYGLIEKQKKQGAITLEIKEGKRKKRKAKMDVKIVQATIEWPEYKKYIVLNKKHPEGIEVSIVEVREKRHRGYKTEPPLVWILITTEEVLTMEEALESIRCYAQRWKIEEFFKLLKTDGYDIESTQLRKGFCIRKLSILAMKTSLKILQLKSVRGGNSEIKIEEVFDKNEIKCLAMLNKNLTGTTSNSRNPYADKSLSWGAWIIARLGGWKGFYKGDSPPGNKTFVWGIDKFEAIMIGYNISKKIDVS